MSDRSVGPTSCRSESGLTQKPTYILCTDSDSNQIHVCMYVYIYTDRYDNHIYMLSYIYIIVHTYSVGAPRAAAASPIPHFHPLMWVTLSHPQATLQTFQISWHVLTSKFAGETMLQNDKLTCLFVCVRSLHCFRLPNGHQLISANSSLNFINCLNPSIPLGLNYDLFRNQFATYVPPI